MALDGAVKVWVLCGESPAPVVSQLLTWGVPRRTAFRWLADWRHLAGDRLPHAVPPEQLRRLVLLKSVELL